MDSRLRPPLKYQMYPDQVADQYTVSRPLVKTNLILLITVEILDIMGFIVASHYCFATASTRGVTLYTEACQYHLLKMNDFRHGKIYHSLLSVLQEKISGKSHIVMQLICHSSRSKIVCFYVF